MQTKLVNLLKIPTFKFAMMSLPQHYGVVMNPQSPITTKLDSLEILISSKEMEEANYTPMIPPLEQLINDPEFSRYLSQRDGLRKKLDNMQDALLNDEEGDGIYMAIKFLPFQEQYKDIQKPAEKISQSIKKFLETADKDKLLSKMHFLNTFFNFGTYLKKDDIVSSLNSKYTSVIDEELDTLSTNSKCMYLRYLFVSSSGKDPRIATVKEDIMTNLKECELEDVYLIYELLGSFGLLTANDTAEIQKALLKLIPIIKDETVVAGIFEMFRTNGIDEFYDNLTLKVVNIIPALDVNARISVISTLFRKYPTSYDDYVFLLKYVVSDLNKVSPQSKMNLYAALKGINYQYEGIDLSKIETEVFNEKFLMASQPSDLLSYYHTVVTTPNIGVVNVKKVRDVIDKVKGSFDPQMKMMLQMVSENFDKHK